MSGLRASRRTRFVRVDECIVLYERPCGCVGRHPNYVPDGCYFYAYTSTGSKWDLIECRLCGAVWTMFDAKPDGDDALRAFFEEARLARACFPWDGKEPAQA